MTLFDLDEPRPTAQLEPVLVEVVRRCDFKRKPCGLCGKPKSNKAHRKNGGTCTFVRKLGCANCGLAMSHADHHGEPPDFNYLGSGNPHMYQSIIQAWTAVLTEALKEAGLPYGLAKVMVDGEAVFSTKRRRDQGNFRVLLEKALGDTLTAGGWLPDDDWDRYEFGNLSYRIEPGVSATRLMIFPSLDVV